MAATNELQLRIKAISDFSDVQSNVQNIQQYLSKLNLPPNLKKNFEGLFGNFEKEASKFQKYLDGGLKSKGDITGLEKSGTQLSSMLKRLKTEVDKLQNENLTELFKGLDVTGIQKAEQKVEQLQNNLKELIAKTNLSKLTKEFGSFGATIDGTFAKMSKSNSVQKFKEAFKSGDIKQMDVALTGLEAHLERYYKTKDGGKKSGYDSFEKDITTLRNLKEELAKIPGANQLEIELREARQELERLTAENTQALENGLRESASGANMTAEGMERVTRETRDAASAAHGLTSEVDMLKSQVSYFFGLTNAVMLFRRALTEALETVKELDAVMTEMSVVTDLSVGDYWDQLPEYSKRAKELGVSIKDAYSAATLYYQQGLKTNEVVAVSSETLKMARIAGMEAKEATDMMTAALRGFNMEINETSAQRINDVYSELAAVTASDTEEIATAMTKTASIAASANMEFETTSALLAQIIETTREAPETAGTAMKTIIARFTEVKELFSEGQLTGTDEEGEAININKIDAALKSVGMSLSGFLQGTQGIDDIFLELASKWDSLDIATQRYIATMAAGSRQQSRFLAMMSDYDRTMELVEAANNSSGASQEQFNKTLDSLETKLNKLSVAWDTFVMGIANNDIIKFGVYALTELLDTINKIIDVASGGSGILKSFFSIGTVAAGLALGKAAFNGIFKQIGAAMAVGAQQTGTAVGAAMGKSMYNSLNASLMTTAAKFKAFSLKNFLITPKVNFAGFAADFKLTGSILTKETTRMNAVTAKYDKMMLRHKQILDSTTASNYAKANSERQVAMIESAYSKIRADSEYRVQQALMSLGITRAQYDLIQEFGRDDDRLAIIMSNEKAKAYFLEKVAQGKLTKEKYEEIVAESLVVHRRKMGIATQAKYYAMLLFGGDVARETALKQLGLATATQVKEMADKGATISQHGFNAALYACPLGWYALAIAAVIGGIALYAKLTETSEEKQKRLNEQIETSSESLTELKSTISDVEDSFNALSEQQEILKGLTAGTSEWNNALVESNNQVLELLQKYPELAKYIEYSNGILGFSAEGQNAYLDMLNQQLATQQLLNTGFSINKTLLDYEIKKQEYENSGYNPLPGGPKNPSPTDKAALIGFHFQIEKLYEEEGELALAAVEENSAEYFSANLGKDPMAGIIYNTSDEFKENRVADVRNTPIDDVIKSTPETFTKYHDEIYRIAHETGQAAEEVYNTYIEFTKLNNELVVANEAVKGFVTSILAANASKDIVEDKQYGNEVIELFNNISAVDYDTQFEAARSELSGKSRGQLVTDYEELTGLEASDEWDKEYLKDQIANYQVMEPILDNMEKFYDIFQELNENRQKQLIGAIKEDGKGFTKTMIESYGKDGKASLDEIMTNTSLDKNQLAELAATLGLLDDDGNGDVDQLVDYVNQNLDYANANIDKVFERFGEFAQGSIGNIGGDQDLSYDALSGISDQLYEVMLANGPLAANNMANAINSAMEGLSQEDAEAFASTLANIDWSSTESVEGLSEQLKGLEVAIDETQVEELEKQIIDFADAADNLTFEEAKADMKELKELSEAMADQEGYVFTEELRDQLIESGKAGADDFVMTGVDEWVYIGGSMEELLKSIEGDTDAILGELAGSLEARVEKGAKWNQIRNRGMTVGDTFYTDTTKAAEDIINGITGATKEEMVQILEAAGVTISNEEQLTEQQVRDLLEKEYANYGFGGSTYERNLAEQKSVAASAYATDRFVIEYGDEGATTPYEAFGYSKQEEFEKNKVFNPEEIEAVKNGLIAQAKQYGVAEEKIEEFTENVLDSEGALNDEAVALLENEIERKRSIKATKDHIEAINEVVDGYTKASQMTEEDKIKLADMFGLSDLSEEDKIGFINNNFSTITDYANGSYEAVKKLTDEYLNLLSQNSVFEVRVDTKTGEVDISSLLEAINTGANTALEAQAIIDQLLDNNLFEVEYKKVKAWTEEPKIESWTSYGVPIYSKDKFRRYYWSEVPVIKRKGQSTFGEGFKGSGGSKGGGGGGGGGGKNEATNDYDRHYNLVQDINAELRTREKLERQYDKLLDDRYADGQDYYELTMKQLESLERQKKLQEQLVAARKEDFKRTISENSKYAKYAWYNASDNTLEIDWGKLEALAKSNPDEYEKVSDYIGQLEEDFDDIKDAEDELEDISDDVKEIKQRGMDEYENLFERTVDALISQEQELIDEQEKICDAIDEASSDLMDAIQSNIDKFRQDRDNKKTEESIAEKERRLAYLRQDTSGANAMEIKKLEEELSDEKESYGDTLIDQAMENLQEQNDAAAEQRERQIELQQSQLDWAEKNGKFNEEAGRIMREGIMNGKISQDSELYQVLAKGEGAQGMSDVSRAKWLDELGQTVYKAYEWAMKATDGTDYMAEILKLFQANGGVVDSEILELNALRNEKIKITGKGTPIDDDDLEAELNIRTPKKGYMAAIQDRYASNGGVIDQQIIDWNKARNKKIAADPTSKQKQYTIDELEAFLKGGGNDKGGNTQTEPKVVNPPVEPAKPTTPTTREYTVQPGDSLSKIAKDKLGNMNRWKEIADLNGLKHPYTIYAGKKLKLPAYKTGGLANFTGPAWLDGTKSKPELVLNARDTENFILLKDVLSSLLHLPKNNQNSAPNSNYFDIDVKVDEIGNDYDVDRMIDRVKEKIYEDSMYRNVNSLNLLR